MFPRQRRRPTRTVRNGMSCPVKTRSQLGRAGSPLPAESIVSSVFPRTNGPAPRNRARKGAEKPDSNLKARSARATPARSGLRALPYQHLHKLDGRLPRRPALLPERAKVPQPVGKILAAHSVRVTKHSFCVSAVHFDCQPKRI